MRSSSFRLSRVAVLGAAGGIGQPLSLLLKNSPLLSELRLYDIRGAPGVAADLSHVCSPAKVTGYDADHLAEAVDGVDLIIIPAGVPRKPGMTRDDLFNVNCGIVQGLMTTVGRVAPKTVIGIVSNPINSTVPIAAETLRQLGVYDPARLFGITTLDVVRARTFVSQALKCSPYAIDVPVIGGHSGETIVPLLSQFKQLSEEQVKALTHRIQFGGDEVVKAKAGAGSATLSMAYAAAEWSFSVMKALRGDKGIVEYTFVESPLQRDTCRWFSSAVELGTNGVEKILPMPELNAYEQGLLDVCLPKLADNIERGYKYGFKASVEP